MGKNKERKIGVVIPVIRQDVVYLMHCLKEQTKPAYYTLIVDNTNEGLPINIISEFFNLPGNLGYYRPESNLGVNDSWKIGLHHMDVDYVALLNDDAQIDRTFFEKADKTFQGHSTVAAVVPKHINPEEDEYQKDILTSTVPEIPIISKMKKREGWSFVVRKTFVDSIPPIPNKLKIFYGDDWFWFWAGRKNMTWRRIENSYVIHATGGKSEHPNKSSKIRQKERKIYVDIVEKKYGGKKGFDK